MRPRIRVNLLDWLIFIFSSLAIFLSSVILGLGFLAFFTFGFLKRMRFLLALTLILIAFIAAWLTYWYIIPVPWRIEQGSVCLIIKEGENMQQVVEQLNQVSILPDGKLFRVVGKLTGLDKKIQAGRYDFEKGVTRSFIFRKLTGGSSVYSDVTIPEGLTVKQIAGILKSKMGVDSVQFIRAADDSTVISRLGIKTSDLEGYLFPNTYNLYWGISPEKVVEMMVGQFQAMFDSSLEKKGKEMGFSLHKTVTLASMIEKETQIDGEREIVSSVFHNRLKLGIPLQCDPTVIYVLPGLGRPLSTDDLEVNSPYNTYKHYGLPPGPICNPGKKSIIAALFPAKTDYLYFVARGDGSHTFSTSLDEHNRARLKAKRENRAKRS